MGMSDWPTPKRGDVLTADRAWGTLQIGIQVDVIR
jgi:hypothetical protein